MRKKMKDGIDKAFLQCLISALQSLGTPRSLRFCILIREREWDELTATVVHPSQYLDTPSGVERYRRDAQAEALVRKVPWPTSFSRTEAAERSFFDSEAKCFETNHIIEWITSGLRPKDRTLSAMREILTRAKKFCTRVLGPMPEVLTGRFGPGTVFELKGSPYATLADKMVTTPSVTPDAEPVFRLMYDQTHWSRARLGEGLAYCETVPGNRFTTVPKDGKTDRGICVEPGGNIWAQLAVGDLMKRLLKRVGLDVARSYAPDDPIESLRYRMAGPKSTGQDTHRRLAKLASFDGSYSTIDLSNASDTVCRRLVRAILPDDWHNLLDSLRSPKTLIQGRWIHLEKFSSMGNGYTFELETLVFAALAHAVSGLVAGVDLFVYGDDIIVPTHTAPDVLACLQAFGFTPNRRKSFHTGFFRESCGGDYFCGVDVRPLFIKDVPSDPLGWMELHNELKKRGLLRDPGLCIGQVPSHLRFFGPPRVQGVFHESEGRWKTYRQDGILWIRRLVAQPYKIPLERWGEWCHLLLALLGCGSRGLVPRDCIRGYRSRRYSIA